MTQALSFAPPLPARPASKALECAHCGLPVPAGQRLRAPAFCCEGCRTVYAIIREHGLANYYKERERASGATARPAKTTKHAYEELDDSSFVDAHCPRVSATERCVSLYLEGVHCSACVWLIENLPRAAPGVREARLDVGRSIAEITYDPEQIEVSQIARTLDGFGYPPHPAAESRTQAERARDRSLLLRIGLAGFSAGNVMLMAFALYGGAFSGMETEYATLFRYGSLLLSLPAVFYSAGTFYRGALASLRTRTPHMDLPIAVGIGIGFVSSAFNTLRGHGDVFFDSLCTLIFLLLVGRFLQQRHHRRAASAAELALALAPTTARLVRQHDTHEVQANHVLPGSLVEVRSGERIPIDGRIERGSSSVDVSLLTGESRAEDVRLGDRVYAGTTNLGETLLLRVERAGAETRVGKLIESVREAQESRAPSVRLADRIAAKFVVIVLALAALTLVVWWHAGAELAIEHAVALLVVTCPCALGMATPLSVSVALRRAASSGLLFKGGEYLEALARPGIMIFDKTGTLTRGQPELVEFDGPAELLRDAAAAEAGAEHPLAKAFRRAAFEDGASEERAATAVEVEPGRGLSAIVAGRRITLGSPTLFADLGIDVPAHLAARVEASIGRALTPVLVARDGAVEGFAAFGDELRPEAPRALAALRRLGWQMLVLSGDDQRVVERVCKDLPFAECHGGVGPDQKLARVREIMASGVSVVMVGDGVNDAAAMSAASVGFAVHGGAEASLLAAHAFSTRAGVEPVLDAVRGARRTMNVIRRGIVFSLLYNAAGVTLALLGILSPLLAAILMPLSSLTVVSSALYSKAFKEAS